MAELNLTLLIPRTMIAFPSGSSGTGKREKRLEVAMLWERLSTREYRFRRDWKAAPVMLRHRPLSPPREYPVGP